MSRYASVISLAVVLVATATGALAQEKLDAMVAYSLKKIPPALDKAERLVTAGDLPNARVYLESAQLEWDMIHKDFKGKFREDHPDIVAVRERLEAVKAMVEAAAGPGDAPPPDPEPEDDPGGAPPLPSTMVYEMKQFGPVLDDVERCVKALDVDRARDSYESALNEWETKKEWNKGKFDPSHPDVVALDRRFAEVGKAVAGLGAQAADAAENLPAALEAVAGSSKLLYEKFDEARSAIRSLSSLRGDFDTGRESDIGKLQARMDAVRVLVEEVNGVLPDALAAARAFREQYPDFKALDKLVREGTRFTGREAGQQVQRLEAFPEQWLQEVRFVIDETLQEAASNIAMYGTSRLEQLQGSDEAVRSSAAGSAEHWVLDYSSILLEIISTLLPELPEAARDDLPELVTARQGYLERAADMEKQIAEVAGAVSKVRGEIVAASKRRLEQARFPESQYTGGEWRDAEKAIRTAWAQKIPDKELVKVSIYSPWETRTEARWVNDHWVVGTYRYIGANCLGRLPSGKYMVYRMRFRNTMQADGGWSPLEQWSVGHVYEILEEHIGK